MEQVSYDDGIKYLEKLSQLTGKKFRLPTETEWEHAARAGTQSTYFWGEGDEEVTLYAWFTENSGSKTHPVAELLPNAFGLHDMAGNVWEWCQDWYADLPNTHVTDPQGPTSGSFRVMRGGGWDGVARYLRSAFRYFNHPDYRCDSVGFRPLRED